MVSIVKDKLKFSLCFLVILLFILLIMYFVSNKDTYALDNENDRIQLNPDWIDYSLKNMEIKSKYNVLPDRVLKLYDSTKLDNNNILDNIFGVGNGDYPTYYNLVDDNLVTPLKNQGTSGLCWAYAGVNSLESNALKKGISSIDKPLIFSESQLDYATGPSSYIYENYNPYHEKVRDNLGVGSYADSAYKLFSNGVSPVKSDVFGSFVDNNYNIKSLSDVFSIDNVEYSVDGYEYIGTVNETTSSDDRNSWVKAIKNHILKYGALSVNTIGPNPRFAGSCLYIDKNQKYLLNVDDNCNADIKENGHAMSIIGWDDNYSYEYCRKSSSTTSDIDSCSNVVSGKGAFILKNSWGDNTAYPYLAYESSAISVMGVTSVSKKNWDNNYDSKNYLAINREEVINTSNEDELISGNYEEYMQDKQNDIIINHIFDDSNEYDGNYYVSYARNNKVVEKVRKISFYNNSINTKYQIKLANNLDKIVKVKDIIPTYIGLQSVDIDDFELNNNKFYVIIESSDKDVNNVNVFTKYIDNNDEVSGTTLVKKSDEEIVYNNFSDSIFLKTATTNIKTGTYLTYRFYDSNNNDITSLFNINNNVVLNNLVNPVVTTNGNNISAGKIRLETYYINQLLDTNYIKIDSIDNIWQEGDGSRSNPFVISNTDDFMKIYSNDIYLRANYKLDNDIDLSDVNDFNNKAKDKVFYGTINGNNHTIYGLKANQALFSKISTAFICNLIISNFDVNINNSNGGLIALESNNSMLQNILIATNNKLVVNNSSNTINVGFVVGKDVNSTFYGIANLASGNFNNKTYVGSIVGRCDSCKIIESYNKGNIVGNIVGGLVGYMNIDYDNEDNVACILNSYNISLLSGNTYAGGMAGVLANAYVINSYVVNSFDKEKSGNIAGYLAYSYINNFYILNNNFNNYYKETGVTNNNVLSYSKEKMIEKSNYSFDFDNIWSIKDNDYPYLKYNNYIKVEDIKTRNKINLVVGSNKTIMDNDIVISPSDSTIKGVKYVNYDKNIIDIKSNNIKALKDGKTTIDVVSLDDDKIKDTIDVVVYDKSFKIDNLNVIEGNYLKFNLNNKKEILDKFNANNNYRFEIVGSSDIVTTGSKFNIYNDNDIFDTYDISVLGDVTGTGEINISDVAKLFQYVQGVRDMDMVYRIAGDVKQDNLLMVNDVAKLFQYVQGKRERLDD